MINTLIYNKEEIVLFSDLKIEFKTITEFIDYGTIVVAGCKRFYVNSFPVLFFDLDLKNKTYKIEMISDNSSVCYDKKINNE